LVSGIDRDAGTRSVIAAVAHQAQLTRRIICAEGVETEAERRSLLAVGVPHGQGYLFSRPVPAVAAVGLLASPLGRTPSRTPLAAATEAGLLAAGISAPD
jgi:EAL domain-containing protein (putative c-di-GMP-specific phosphodiesterase class I)